MVRRCATVVSATRRLPFVLWAPILRPASWMCLFFMFYVKKTYYLLRLHKQVEYPSKPHFQGGCERVICDKLTNLLPVYLVTCTPFCTRQSRPRSRRPNRSICNLASRSRPTPIPFSSDGGDDLDKEIFLNHRRSPTGTRGRRHPRPAAADTRRPPPP